MRESTLKKINLPMNIRKTRYHLTKRRKKIQRNEITRILDTLVDSYGYNRGWAFNIMIRIKDTNKLACS